MGARRTALAVLTWLGAFRAIKQMMTGQIKLGREKKGSKHVFLRRQSSFLIVDSIKRVPPSLMQFYGRCFHALQSASQPPFRARGVLQRDIA